tara:strand:- start:21019 stop:21831 length:813 start_codon:yes stop_codon:yes gene_type:complete
MSVFEISSYKDIIKYKVGLLKKVNFKYTFDSLAKAIDVHKPYLSRVLNQKGDLSSDQIYKCSRYLKFSDLEKQYFALVYEENISTLPDRKSMLTNEMDKIRRKALKSDVLYPETPQDIERPENYFLDPYHALVHMHLLIPKYKNNTDLIAAKLNLSKPKVNEYVEALHDMQIINKTGSEIKIMKEFVRLPDSSHLMTSFRNLSKLKALEKITQLPNEDYLSMHVFFVADNSGKQKIQKLFLDFLNEAKKIADKSKCEDVYQLNFDLLKWS